MADITLRTRKTQEMIDIHSKVADEVGRGVDGLVWSRSAWTAAVVINENADSTCARISGCHGEARPEGHGTDWIETMRGAIKATIWVPARPCGAGRRPPARDGGASAVEFDGPRDRR